MNNEKIYLACYSTGEFGLHIVFASTDKSKVTKWVTKFNKMHERWKEHYDQYCDNRYGDAFGRWIKEEHYDKSPRWLMLRNINSAYCDKIERR